MVCRMCYDLPTDPLRRARTDLAYGATRTSAGATVSGWCFEPRGTAKSKAINHLGGGVCTGIAVRWL
eukprot:1157659-Rhodomonas_salina.1